MVTRRNFHKIFNKDFFCQLFRWTVKKKKIIYTILMNILKEKLLIAVEKVKGTYSDICTIYIYIIYTVHTRI